MATIDDVIVVEIGEQGPTGPQGPQGPQGLNGVDGQNFTINASGTSAERSLYDGESDGFIYLDTDLGGFYRKITGGWSDIVLYQGPQGDTGPQGPQGIQGVQGIQGDTGPQGPQGIQGLTGDTGPQGPQGIQGIQGVQGDKGDTGDTGPQGPQGIQGDTGPQGPQGIQGDTGPQGPQGIQGLTGDTGPQGPQGLTGDTGPQGIQGPAGVDGSNGLDGVDGDSAYQVAVNNGFIGTELEWLASLVGPEGPQGIQGIQGIQGEQGIQGPQGDTGPQGPQGIQGIQGLTGDTGPTGADGLDGKTVLNGTVDPTTEGVDGDFFINTTSDQIFGPKTAGVWGTGTSLIGPQGPQGIQGEQGIQGIQGETGLTGDTGPQGPQGIQGDIGPQGPAGADGTNGVGVPIGGTTGQVLSKNSTTDYDTGWSGPMLPLTGGNITGQVDMGTNKITNLASPTVSTDAANANYVNAARDTRIEKAIIDAKGDLIVGTANNTYQALTVGSNKKVLVADSAQTTGLKWDYVTPTISSPSFSSNMTIDVTGMVDVVRFTMTSNSTIGFTGGTDGQKIIVEITQDATGGRTITWGSSVRFGTDITSVTLTTSGNKTDRVGLIYNATAGKYDVVAFVRGF